MRRGEGMTAVGRTGRAWVLALALVLPGCGSGGGESPPTAPAVSPPPQATGLTAQAGDGEVALSWTAIAVATRWDYRLRIGDGGWGAWTAVPGGGSATTGHTVTDLENGTAYGFQVRAASAGGAGPASAEATATPVPPVPPAAEGLTATAGDHLVELSWTVLGEASGWEYRMRIGDGAWGAWTEVPGSGPDTTGHSVTGLANGTAYGFQVRAVNAGGAGPRSLEVIAAPFAPGVPVDIPDPNLRQALERRFGKEPGATITDMDMRNLSELRAESKGIHDLTGIEHATGLEKAYLARNTIVDLSPLAGLTSLEHLGLSYNDVVDLQPLSGLTSLRRLNLGPEETEYNRESSNRVSDLSPLSALGSLSHLELSFNEVSDISPLAGLASLEHLGLTYNDVFDLQPVSGLASLTRLALGGTRVSDLTPLSGLASLVHLELWRTAAADISPLAGLTSLEYLDLEFNEVVDVRPLGDLALLTDLYLSGNRIVDVSVLGGLRSLEVLSLGANPVADVEPLAVLTSLRRLDLSEVRAVEDLSFVSRMAQLTHLYLSHTSVKNLGPVASLSQLETLSISETGVSHLSPLESLGSLRTLIMSGLSADLAPLAELTSLENIWQVGWRTDSGLPKVDIAPLAGLRKLEDLGVSPLYGDLSPLAGLASLEWLYLEEPGTPFENVHTLEGLTELLHLKMTQGGLDGIPRLEAPELYFLNLQGNRIEDLVPLAGATAMLTLNLDDNRVVDIADLVANAGIGDGDSISLVGNPLGADALLTHIPELESRGVTVEYDRDDFPDSPLRMLRDEAVSMRVDADLDTAVVPDLDLAAYTREFLAHFGDEFDVLLFVSALPYRSDHADPRYAGVYLRVSNDVDGIGLDASEKPTYGSTRLKGVMHFHDLRALARGPSLHELMHMWANYGVQTSYDVHWGFSSAAGQLGGFRQEDLVDLGDGLWTAGSFGTYANGGNGLPYSPWELYLGGFIGPEDVPDLWVAAEGHWTGERTEAGHRIFEAAEHSTLTVEAFVETHGPREPDHVEAPKELRGAVIVLEDDDHQLRHWNVLLEQVRWLSHPGRHLGFDDLYNYHEATGGRGSLVLDGLLDLRRETPPGARALRLEQVCPPPDMPAGTDASLLAAPWTDLARPTFDNGGNRVRKGR